MKETQQVVTNPIYPPFIGQIIEARSLLEKVVSVELCPACVVKFSPLLQEISNLLMQSIDEHEAMTVKSLRLKIVASEWAELSDYERLVLLQWRYLKVEAEKNRLQEEGFSGYNQYIWEGMSEAQYIPVLEANLSEPVVKIAYQWAKALFEEVTL